MPGFPNGVTRHAEGMALPMGERTQGTETSHYLQEEKINNDSASSGDRTRKSPNRQCFGTVGVVGLRHRPGLAIGTVWKVGP